MLDLWVIWGTWGLNLLISRGFVLLCQISRWGIWPLRPKVAGNFHRLIFIGHLGYLGHLSPLEQESAGQKAGFVCISCLILTRLSQERQGLAAQGPGVP